MSTNIKYFKAINFAGIYAGTGKTEIEIFFSDGKIIMLLGDNGSGKSTLLSILHPLRETFDNRKNIIIDGKDGYKEIHLYRDDNNSSIETEKNFDMFFNDSILGYPFPLSHFETAVLETNNCSASCS